MVVQENCVWLSESEDKAPKECVVKWLKLRLKGRRLHRDEVAKDEVEMRWQKKYVWKFIKKKRERLKYVYKFRRKMNEDVDGIRKLFWKEAL